VVATRLNNGITVLGKERERERQESETGKGSDKEEERELIHYVPNRRRVL
jgi:hypothetical protein